jgi:hypothetical protein
MPWKCIKCGIGNDTNITRCSFCSEPQPPKGAREKKEVSHNEDKTRMSLHAIIEKLHHKQRVRLFRWMEDNIL